MVVTNRSFQRTGQLGNSLRLGLRIAVVNYRVIARKGIQQVGHVTCKDFVDLENSDDR